MSPIWPIDRDESDWGLGDLTTLEAREAGTRARPLHGPVPEASGFHGNPILSEGFGSSLDPDRQFRLLASAMNELAAAAKLAGHEPWSGSRRGQFVSIDKLLRTFVTADGPTPQVRYRGPDGYDIRWLVDGDVVSLLVDDDDGVNVWINDGRGTVQFDQDFADAPEAELGAADTIRQWLKNMSTRIRYPIVAFGPGA